MIKLLYVTLSCVAWFVVAVVLVKTLAMWTMVSGKLAGEEKHQLQASLFAAAASGAPEKDAKTWVAIGDRLFLSGVEDAAPQGRIQPVLVPRPNICKLGKAIAAHAEAFDDARYLVQASPHFWSNFAPVGGESEPHQSLTYWDLYASHDVGVSAVMRAFFGGIAILARPSRPAKADFDARLETLRFLAFRTDGRAQNCFKRRLQGSGVEAKQIVFVKDTRQFDLASNSGLVSAFDACIDEGTCFAGAKFTILEQLGDDFK